jgi:hypothetical protein
MSDVATSEWSGPRPLDDTANFPLTRRQQHIHRKTEERRLVQRMADEIAQSLGSYAARLEREGLYVRGKPE